MGVPISPFFAKILAFNKKVILPVYGDETMRNLIVNRTTGNTYVEVDIIRMNVLAETLRVISMDPLGVHEFYNGSIARKLVHDIRQGGNAALKGHSDMCAGWIFAFRSHFANAL